MHIIPFELPTHCEIPGAFPSPFDELGPPLLARRAAEKLQAELRQGFIAPGLPTTTLDGPAGGKMFGVLVVRDAEGRIGYLKAFSGLLGGHWEIDGFVPPLFNRTTRERVESIGEATVKALFARFEALEGSQERSALRSELDTLSARHADEQSALRLQHETNRRERHAARASATTPGALHALDQASRGDKAERRRTDARQEEERRSLTHDVARLERRLRALERLRRFVCRRLMQQIHDTYLVPNARGETKLLRALYAPGEPPSGTADCAAPKLLAAALSNGLQPLALAEFWWGTPPASGGRVTGGYYPACRDKCGPLLPFMLEGLDVTVPRAFVPADVAAQPLPIVFEDPWLIVIEKPSGLLSVPGRNAAVTDSVLARLRAGSPRAAELFLVHRLDLDTSGLLVAAKDLETYTNLQRQFARREVQKRYVAWLEGGVEGEQGIIDFPMRVDLDDRPRQIHDPVHGKAAVTEWQVLERKKERTRVALFPRTGRTHQLRVHAAHPLGLGRPIVGDRLYGHEDQRLLLHAEALAFKHPQTGQWVAFERPAPF